MFENIIGNEIVKQKLQKGIELKKVSHSYMFVGTDGIGKKMFAKELSKALMCLNENASCCKCKSCIEFDSGNSTDYFYIEPQESKSIKIDQIREMQKTTIEKPIIAKRKTYIINDADKMTKEAQNCLLKTLEEPPEYVTIILIGVNENSFLSTIKSRCTIIHFNELKKDELKRYLQKENIELEEEMLDLAEGSIKQVLKLKQNEEMYKNIYGIFKNIAKINPIDLVKKADILYKSKDEILEVLGSINIMLLKLSYQNINYAKCIDIVEDTKRRLLANSNFDMCIDNMLFSIWEELNEKNNWC